MASLALFGDDLDMNGTPTPAVEPSAPAPAASSSPADILVVASQAAAQDGSYQALVTELSGKGKVEMQMVDRIVEGGESHQLLVDYPIRNQRYQRSAAAGSAMGSGHGHQAGLLCCIGGNPLRPL